MLSGPGFSYYAVLAHALGEKHRAESIVDFVGTCVIEILSFEIDIGVVTFAQPVCPVEWGGAAYIVA